MQVRYFTKQEDPSPQPHNRDANRSPTKNSKIIAYNVEVKPSVFGRRHADKQKVLKRINNPNPKFKGRLPIPKEVLEKYGKGKGLNRNGVRTSVHKQKLERKEKNIQFSHEQAARAETLLIEDLG